MSTRHPGLTQHHNLVPYPFSEITPAPSAVRPRVIWLTGLSAAGKSTIVDSLNPVLQARGLTTCILDGDSVRNGLCRDLSFSAEDREENVRRVAEVAALMVDAGLTVMVALISPTRSARKLARSIIGSARFVEVFVDVPLAVAEARDPKGLYRRARAGGIPGFTGVDSAYEPPVFPDLHIRSDEVDVRRAVKMIDDWLLARG
ncbi:adenylyl-sulfate kinase [Pseudomonas sp. W2Oct36]|uniref:adenylyl-sulfate kinase n=1 Tax=unclassified Pseudomonas TaxID=196821 RepID=UPI001785F9D5|nr:adenylyl-sulfate kinase [Pseudomonas sp. CFBP 8772]MBD8599930.1 adenylyl-sulfate kinase [Pseudomonas sp. CFBP 8772]